MSIAKTKVTGRLNDYPGFRDNTPAISTLSAKQKLRAVEEPVVKVLPTIGGR